MVNSGNLFDTMLIKVLLYGLAGTGKTTLALSGHVDKRVGPALYLNYEGNPDLMRHWPDPPAIIDMHGSDDIYPAISWLRAGQSQAHPFYKKNVEVLGDAGYRLLVVDLFSVWQQQAIDTVTGVRGLPTSVASIVAPEALLHGNKILATTMQTGRALLELPMHVILVLQQKEEIDFTGANLPVQMGPWLWGGSKNLLPHTVKLVSRLEQVKVKGGGGPVRYVPKAIWASSSVDGAAKNQLAPPELVIGPDVYSMQNHLGLGMEAPSMKKILDQIEKYFDEIKNKNFNS